MITIWLPVKVSLSPQSQWREKEEEEKKMEFLNLTDYIFWWMKSGTGPGFSISKTKPINQIAAVVCSS